MRGENSGRQLAVVATTFVEWRLIFVSPLCGTFSLYTSGTSRFQLASRFLEYLCKSAVDNQTYTELCLVVSVVLSSAEFYLCKFPGKRMDIINSVVDFL